MYIYDVAAGRIVVAPKKMYQKRYPGYGTGDRIYGSSVVSTYRTPVRTFRRSKKFSNAIVGKPVRFVDYNEIFERASLIFFNTEF